MIGLNDTFEIDFVLSVCVSASNTLHGGTFVFPDTSSQNLSHLPILYNSSLSFASLTLLIRHFHGFHFKNLHS